MTKVKFKTALGELRWVFIAPGGKDTSVNGASPSMKKVANLIVKEDSKEAKQMLDQLQKIWEELRAANGIKQVKFKSNGAKQMRDKDTKEPNGELCFCFKTSATYKDGKDVEIPIYNAKGERTHLGESTIGNGSLGIIHGEAALYEFSGTYGITLYLKAIQLVKLVEYTGTDVDVEDLTVVYPDAFGEPFEAGTNAVQAVATPVDL